MARRREAEQVEVDDSGRTPLDDVLDQVDREGPNPRLYHEEWPKWERWNG